MKRSPRLLGACLVASLSAFPVAAANVTVRNPAELASAIDRARAGDVITLAPGTYTLGSDLTCDAPGTPDRPITVRAARLGEARLRLATVEGFRVAAPHWRFENLDIQGVCASDDACEHAFHLFGGADGTVIRGNRIRDFNAQIKSNGAGTPPTFPDDVLIEDNELADTRPRRTSRPVAKIDVVGGRRWIVRRNLIHDFEKGAGDGISYAGFLKGHSRDGLFERNLVICERDFGGGTRLGLSFGGGGTGGGSQDHCEGGTCLPSHENGTMRNNVVLSCPDVGIYVNAAANTTLAHNTLYDTAGIHVRFPDATAVVRNNLLSGTIRDRDGGTSARAGNVESVPLAAFESWFRDPAAADFAVVDGLSFVDLGVPGAASDDYCGTVRGDGAPDVGAVEAPGPACATADPRATGALFQDGFETGGLAAWGG